MSTRNSSNLVILPQYIEREIIKKEIQVDNDCAYGCGAGANLCGAGANLCGPGDTLETRRANYNTIQQ